MSAHLSSTAVRRTASISSGTPILRGSSSPSSPTYICQQCRHATLLRRPKRPYTFTQLVTLTDGSTFTQRTTSPAPVYKCTKDTRNNPLWNPTSQKLLNVEADEAGKLRAFRERFGRGWDAASTGGETAEETPAGEEQAQQDEEEESLLDLISAFGQDLPQRAPGVVVKGGEAMKKRKK